MPTLACYETASFNTSTCAWVVTGTQPAMPTLACYETASFNNSTCQWVVTGTQPAIPTLACYETASFNTTSCSWVVSGTQPAMPTLACYQTASFNTTSCQWVVTGTQPDPPTGLACYETATFNNTTCVWDVAGSATTPPSGLACYQTASFNVGTCAWVVTGTQPAMPTLACYETASFNNSTCAWVVTGTQPAAPTGLACYETANFNTTSCQWVVSGTQPSAPTGLACYETASFNTTTCAWVVTSNGATATYYADADGDTYGNAASSIQGYICSGIPRGYVTNSLDCNDNPSAGGAAIYPGATEICFNLIDDNCDGNIDEGCGCSNPPTATAGSNFSVCVNATASLNGSVGGGASNGTWSTSGTGTFSPAANVLNATYVPSSADYAAGSVTLTLTSNAIFPCTPATSSLTLSFNPLPATPGTITGPTSLCNPSTAGIFTYSVAQVAGATSYSWTVPAGVVIQGSATGSSISVKFTATAIHNGITGNICVTPNNGNGCGAASSSCLGIKIQISAPVQPSSISGPDRACAGDVYVYSVASVARAGSYNWVVPANSTITAGAGTNIITVTYGAGFTGGSITVSASNPCGTGATRSRTVVQNILPAPAGISGMVNGVCGAVGAVYSITAPVTGAVSYQWSVPANVSITSNAGTSITVSFLPGFVSGNISVSAVNNCGVGTARTITVNGYPGTPSAISGTNPACLGTINMYSIGTVTGATGYNWLVSNSASLQIQPSSGPGVGQGQKNIEIRTNAASTIAVNASNACGVGRNQNLSVTTTFCTRIGDATAEQNLMDIRFYPNPVNDILNMAYTSISSGDVTIRMYDATGRLVLTAQNQAVEGDNQISLNVGNILPLGFYIIEVQQAERIEKARVIIGE
jgi:hypothetical protein